MSTASAAAFGGFSQPKENWFKCPLEIIDLLPRLHECTLKVTMYVIRHTWGFHEYDEGKRISLDEFMHGRKRRNGTRIDDGIKMAKNSVLRGIEEAVVLGILEVETDSSDPARTDKYYMLKIRDDNNNSSDSSGQPPTPQDDDNNSDQVIGTETGGSKFEQGGVQNLNTVHRKILEERNSKDIGVSNAAQGYVLFRGLPPVVNKGGRTNNSDDDKLEPETELEKAICAISGARHLTGAQVNRLNRELKFFHPEKKEMVQDTLNALYESYPFQQWIKHDVLVRLERKKSSRGLVSRDVFLREIEKLENFSSWWKMNPQLATKQEVPKNEELAPISPMSMMDE